jgi:hypothetical protein
MVVERRAADAVSYRITRAQSIPRAHLEWLPRSYRPMTMAAGFSYMLVWVWLEDVAAERPIFLIVRFGILAALVLVGLRAAAGELSDTDVVQFYWTWFNEVRHRGGV